MECFWLVAIFSSVQNSCRYARSSSRPWIHDHLRQGLYPHRVRSSFGHSPDFAFYEMIIWKTSNREQFLLRFYIFFRMCFLINFIGSFSFVVQDSNRNFVRRWIQKQLNFGNFVFCQSNILITVLFMNYESLVINIFTAELVHPNKSTSIAPLHTVERPQTMARPDPNRTRNKSKEWCFVWLIQMKMCLRRTINEFSVWLWRWKSERED